MKKLALLILLSLTIFITGCSKDSIKFKKEYESLNGKLNSNNQIIRSINISKDNPFIYKSAFDIVTMMENKETFIVYFGFAKCPWCRSVLENLIKALKDNNISKVYYVDVYDIRDTLSIEDGNVVKVKEADESYYKLLELMAPVLSKYIIDGHDLGYRIYAPNVVAVKDGVAVSMTTGVSEMQDNAYMSLTDEMNKESYNMFNNLIKSLDTCYEKC